ncbi:CCA tRNA nucleotidyltransferase [Solirubrobacter soli]|uniref:CCA tRNA nucleotidyltransferase n=1 Tax=Solirubrobacter soli TaxID=363832 RepID=UPI0004868BBC|nr:CCA tRNA nucleotidyltransferase [Solirubrobacter soli]
MDPLRAAPGADIVLAAVAGEPGVHVVGGAVRDALRGQVPRELDLVVEGDAVSVARHAAERVGGTLTVHERFGTATIRTGDFAFDIAGARRETYERPGALPTVALGATIEEDLARRDFTVNAMAVSLSTGDITQWPGARDDLDAGVLRVLHDRSFIDDPTRMLRLVRYAARLEFAVAASTDALIDPALLDTVTGDRAGNELRLALKEPFAALELLDRYGLGRALLGEHFAVNWLAERAGPGVLALAACATAIPREELAARLNHLGFERQDRDVVVAAAGGFERLHGHLDGSDAEVWRLLRRERPETVQLLAAGGDEGAQRYLNRIRHRKLSISGDDLVAQGLKGPQVGEGLARAMEAMLDGRAPDKQSQLAAAIPS